MLKGKQRVNAIKQPTEVFYKKTVQLNFTIFTGIHLCWRPATLLKRDSNTGTLSSEYDEILKNVYFAEHLRTTLLLLGAAIEELTRV